MDNWRLDNIAQASKNCGKIYISYLGFSGYCLLTVLTITDQQLVLSSPIRLPLINATVPLKVFLYTFPLFSFGLLTYLLLYLYRIKRLIVDEVNENQKFNPDKLFPWMVIIAEYPDAGLVGRFQTFFIRLSLWGILPIILCVHAAVIVKKHEYMLSQNIGIMVLALSLIVFVLWFKYDSLVLQKKRARQPRLQGQGGINGILGAYGGKLLFIYIILSCHLFIYLVVLPAAVSGRYDLLTWSGIDYSSSFYIDLSYRNIVSEPSTDYENTYWLDLRGSNLAGSNLASAVLKRSDFRNVNLDYSNLERANLESGDFRKVEFKWTFFRASYLRSSVFEDVNCMGVNFSHSNLDDSKFNYSRLIDTDIGDTYMSRVEMRNAELRRTIINQSTLNHANLAATRFIDCVMWGIKLDSARMDGVIIFNSTLPHSWLQAVSLKNASFINSNLFRSKLRGSDCEGARFDNSYLAKVDLREARGLTLEQLSKAFTLAGAELDPNLYRAVQETYPQLLQHPSDTALSEWMQKYQKDVPETNAIDYQLRRDYPFLKPPLSRIEQLERETREALSKLKGEEEKKK